MISTLSNIEKGKLISQIEYLSKTPNLMVRLEAFSLNSGTNKSTHSHHFHFTLS